MPALSLLPILMLACAGLHNLDPTPAAAEASQPGAPGWSEVVEAAMPSVVLILAEREGEPGRFGAGIVMDQTGRVLSNHHIVAQADRLTVLAYEPGRLSYSPLEGGIQRLVFEHREDLLPATVLVSDPLLDLVLLQVRGLEDAAGLPVREEPVRIGEPVLALGHPQQSVWSFTAGVVSAIHQGVIQHDAPVNPGNSGGPLIDSQGRLVGVNTFELLGGSEGLAFARPLRLATPLLEGGRALELNLSAPDSAFLSCEQAVDLAPWQALDCVWWDGEHRQLLAAVERVRADLALPPEVDQRLRKQVWERGYAAWIGAWQQQVVRFLSGGLFEPVPSERLDWDALWPSPEARAEHAASLDAATVLRGRIEALREHEAGFVAERARRGGPSQAMDPAPYRQARTMGQRLEQLYLPTDQLALMQVQAHLPDGSPHAYTECWVLLPGGWRQRMLCPPEYLRLVPEDWPLPLLDHHAFLESFEIELWAAILGLGPGDLELEDGA